MKAKSDSSPAAKKPAAAKGKTSARAAVKKETAKAKVAVPKSKPAPAAADSAAKGRKRVVFTVQAEPGSEVCVAGDFNGWEAGTAPLADAKGTGIFSRRMMLPPGRYEYKFVINGSWSIDPGCESWTTNDHGTLNSVLVVG
ncbi:MAG: glycogen-binding domain-containing protein [Verrucomicrobiales bacterium]